jgi:hypothetical protein
MNQLNLGILSGSHASQDPPGREYNIYQGTSSSSSSNSGGKPSTSFICPSMCLKVAISTLSLHAVIHSANRLSWEILCTVRMDDAYQQTS